MSNPHRPGIAAGRYLWVGLALVVLVLLGLTFPLAAPALERAEIAARERAERTATAVLTGAISPRVASGDVVGAERRDLLLIVQARILDDDRVAQVLIWRPDGDLIFSTAPGDDTSEVFAADDLQFSQAASGAPASVVVDASDGTGAFHRTFVPLRPPDGTTPFAIAQIDQRYGAIEAEANGFWRPAQIVLLVALVLLAGLFALSLRSSRSAPPVPEPQPRGSEEAMNQLEERVRAAEAVAEKAKERLAVAQRQIEDASTLQVPPSILAQVAELESQLESEVAERERSAEEMRGLRAALEARDAELTLARERAAAMDAELARDGEDVAAAVEAETARSAEAVSTANRRAEDAEKRAGQAEQRAEQAEQRAEQAEQRAERAEQRAAEADRRAKDVAERIALSEANVTELETALRRAGERAGRAGGDAERAQRTLPESAASILEVELLRSERDIANADLHRAQRELEALRAELEEVRASASATQPPDPA
jgi:hypothetical protein